MTIGKAISDGTMEREPLSRSGVRYFFMTDGENRRGIGAPVCRVRQVHGKEIVEVDEGNCAALAAPSPQVEADGLATRMRGTILAVASADCVPLLLFDEEKKVIAAVHAGWRGSFERIGPAALEKMTKKMGGSAAHVRCLIGPSIRSCCFEVRSDLTGRFLGLFPGWADLISDSGNRMTFDLQEFNRRQLVEAGVSPDKIHILPVCTFCDPGRLPSYRRDGKKAGRMLSGIILD
ncbi:MAG TPA: peptidoglycan editing factor PgeF [Nitrospiria bacterium]|nr:peptidoglycan editing factor PgeF [Nitrospiria bacterium]